MNFLSYSGGKVHVNPSAVRKLTDHKANGVNYTGFLGEFCKQPVSNCHPMSTMAPKLS